MKSGIKLKSGTALNIQDSQSFYTSVNYDDLIARDNLLFAAYDGAQMVGLVRLAHEHGHLLLRGMMVAISHQRQGIGHMLLRELEKQIGAQDCYLRTHPWLESFYGTAGFKKISDADTPDFLLERVVLNRIKYPGHMAMKRGGLLP